MEHPDLPSHPTTGQDVGLLVVEGEGGPCQGEEVLLDILVFVLHQDFPRVDVDDADGVAAAGRHPRCRLALLLGVGLKDNLEQVVVKTGETKMQKRHLRRVMLHCRIGLDGIGSSCGFRYR